MIWDIVIMIFSTRSPKEAIQLFLGTIMYAQFGPIVNFTTQLYTLYKLDDFRWGKTRIAVSQK
jgi:chitin synthase